MCMSRISLSGIYDDRSKGRAGSTVCILSLSESVTAPGQRCAVHEFLCRMLSCIGGNVSKKVGRKDR